MKRRPSTLVTPFAVASILVACGELKSAPLSSGDGGASSAASPTGPSTGPSPTTTGAGPYGALPSGYCCTSDDECRNRHCAAVAGGQKMCLDECHLAATCARDDVVFTCDSPDGFEDGLCQPPSGFLCIPTATFPLGTKKIGACCTPTGDGNAGLECEGGLCVERGPEGVNNPFVCTNVCKTPADCGSGFICTVFTDTGIKYCVPAMDRYTCN